MPEITLPTKLTQDQIKTIVDQILLQVNQKNTSKTKRSLTFTSDATWNIPSGVTEIYVTGGGGGGSGSAAGTASSTGTKGINGTDTVITNGVNVLTLKGGKGGELATATTYNTTATGGSPGGPGGQSGGTSRSEYTTAAQVNVGGDGGNSGPYYGGRYTSYQGSSIYKNGNYCSGGAGAQPAAVNYFSNGGGGAEFVYAKPFQVTPLSQLSIVIGKGGVGVNGGTGYISGNGGDGIVTIEWWE